MVDLGTWAEEGFRVPSEEPLDDESLETLINEVEKQGDDHQ